MHIYFKNFIKFIIISLVILNIFSLVFLDEFYARSDWGIGEYLINYSNGFVRRGLLGNLYLELYNYNPLFLDYVVYLKILLIFLLLYLITQDLSFYPKALDEDIDKLKKLKYFLNLIIFFLKLMLSDKIVYMLNIFLVLNRLYISYI